LRPSIQAEHSPRVSRSSGAPRDRKTPVNGFKAPRMMSRFVRLGPWGPVRGGGPRAASEAGARAAGHESRAPSLRSSPRPTEVPAKQVVIETCTRRTPRVDDPTPPRPAATTPQACLRRTRRKSRGWSPADAQIPAGYWCASAAGPWPSWWKDAVGRRKIEEWGRALGHLAYWRKSRIWCGSEAADGWGDRIQHIFPNELGASRRSWRPFSGGRSPRHGRLLVEGAEFVKRCAAARTVTAVTSSTAEVEMAGAGGCSWERHDTCRGKPGHVQGRCTRPPTLGQAADPVHPAGA